MTTLDRGGAAPADRVEPASARRASLLQALTAALGAAITPDAVVRAVLELAVPALDATTGLLLVWTADHTALTAVGEVGYPPALVGRFAHVSLDTTLPVVTAVREGRPVWVDDRAQAAREFPALVAVHEGTRSHATATLPLRDAGGAVVGALAFNFGTPHPFDPETHAILDTIAGQCAQALERARLFAAERAARAEAEAARARTAGVLDAMADAYFALDHEFRIVAANPAMERAGGLPRDQMLGRTLWSLFPRAAGTPVERHYREVAATGREAHFTHDYTPQGTDLVVEVDAYPAPDGGIVVFWRDVTPRARADAERARLLAEAETAQQALAAANAQLQDQATELEIQAEELQDTASSLEEQVEAAARVTTLLRASEARYRALLDSVDVGFCVLEVLVDDGDPARPGRPVDWRFLESNAAFVRQVPYGDPQGRRIREIAPDMDAFWIEFYARVAATGEPARVRQDAVALGRVYDVFAYRVDDPALRHVAVLFTDITADVAAAREREGLLAELAAERERLAEIVRLAPAFMAVLRGPDHVIELTNAGYDALVGGRAVRGRPVVEALPEASGQGFVALLDRVLATGAPFVGHEQPYRRPDDTGAEEERFVDFIYQPLTEADGTRSGVFVHGVDVTDQVRARRQVERLLAEAEASRASADAARAEADRANRAKSEFLATMSHEIRTPINAITGYAQLVELGVAGPVSEAQRDYLGRLNTAGQHLLGLVNDVLDLAKIDAGEVKVARTEATTEPAVTAALDLVRPQAAARGVGLVLASPEVNVPYIGDEHRVRQVLVNLLSNAVKFTEPGGSVTVTCGMDAETPAAGRLFGAGPWAYVRVADTGIGIPADQQAAVFEPFHQVEQGHTRTKGGTGLGLAISRRLARLMGGDLSLESVPGRGATFTLWLPCAGGTEWGEAGADETAVARLVRAAHTRPEIVSGLGNLGSLLRHELDAVVAAYSARLLESPAGPLARGMKRSELEDHIVTGLVDLAQSLVIIGEAGTAEVGLLADSVAINVTVAERHGARRMAQGWDEEGLRTDYAVLREVLADVVRASAREGLVDVDGALVVLTNFIEQSESRAITAWRAAHAQTTPL